VVASAYAEAQNWFTGEDFEDFDEHEGLNLIIR